MARKWRGVTCTQCGKHGDALHKVKHTLECLKTTLAKHEAVQDIHVRTFGHEADLSVLKSEIVELESKS